MTNEIDIRLTFTATLRRASSSDCAKFDKPKNSWELLDQDGFRVAWIDAQHSEQAARDAAIDVWAEGFYSSGFTPDM